MKYIWYELKRAWTTSTTWIALVFVLVCCVTMLSNISNQHDQEEAFGKELIIGWGSSAIARIDDNIQNDLKEGLITKEESMQYRESLQEFKEVYQKFLKTDPNKNWKEYEYLAILNLIYNGVETKQMINADNDFYDYLVHEDIFTSLKNKYLPNKNIVFPHTEAEERSNHTMSNKLYFQGANYYLQYFDQLYTHHVKPQNRYAIGSVESVYHYLHLLFPVVLLLVSAVLIFDTFEKDIQSGAIKTMVQAKNRFTYIKTKVLVSFINILIVCFLPITMIFASYAMDDHVQGLQTPMLSYQIGMTSFQQGHNLLKKQQDLKKAQQEGLSQIQVEDNYLGMVQYSQISYDPISFFPDNSLTLISLGKFLMLSLCLAILSIVFMISLMNTCMCIFKRKTIGLLCGGGIMLIGYFLSSPANTSVIGMLNPFQYLDPTLIVGGTSAYTFLSGVCVLIIYSILLFIISFQVFKRKDIA